ncbi:MAG TPA: SagB family peptide dehydrogenase, partial [Candidatus Binataceae bacterium]|nr:SagB family peptide dehydrogenase [Candidatus Binataceae bacterium]
MGNDFIDAARAYHEVTKHSYTSVRSSPHYLDWDIRPLPYKIYPGAAHIALPRDLSLSRIPALEAIAEVAPLSPRKALDVGALARILFCADGLTRRKSVGGEDYHFRAAPSAGALYPIELYAATAEVEGIEAGLYHFSPGDLRMAGLRRGDWREYIAHAAAGRPSILHARAVIVLTSIFWRSAWKYRARAFRYCFWDAGTILANLLAATYAEGLATEIVTAFADPTIEALLGIDGEREGTVAIVAIGETESPAGVSPDAPALALETIPLSSNEIVYDGITKIQRESRLLTPAEAAAVAHAEIEQAVELVEGNPFRFDPIPPHDAMGLGETILNRGSMRIFGQAPVPARELATIMAASSGHPRSDFSRLTDTYLIVNAIEEMEPGAYYYNRVARGF